MKRIIFYLYGLHNFFCVYFLVVAILLGLNNASWQGNETKYMTQGYDYWASVRIIVFVLVIHMFYKLWYVVVKRSKLVDYICSEEKIDRDQFFSRNIGSIVSCLKLNKKNRNLD